MIYIGTREYKYGRMLMSHMIADALNELHTMAALLNIKRKYFQDKKGRPHYDICKSKKQEALGWDFTDQIKLVNDKEIINILKDKYQPMKHLLTLSVEDTIK